MNNNIIEISQTHGNLTLTQQKFTTTHIVLTTN